ncbi:hypothetical protein HZS_1314 [Henneguya salminicola]|nr:hypothetical protein HZS_1314 [Henneguya salminicola]
MFIAPWTSYRELHEVVCNLNNQDIGAQLTAYHQLLTWHLRSNELPLAISSTISILSCRIEMLGCQKFDHTLVLSISMSISRFVTTILQNGKIYFMNTEKFNKSSSPLMKAAEKFKVPKWLVSFRHLTTHDSLNCDFWLLKYATDFCYNWLLKQYWNARLQNSTYINNYNPDPKQYNLFYSTLTNIIKRLFFNNSEITTKLINLKKFSYYYDLSTEIFLKWLVLFRKLSPSNWPDRILLRICKTTPLCLEFIYSHALTNERFIYLCSLIHDKITWEKFEENFILTLSKFYNAQPVNEFREKIILSILNNSLKKSQNPVAFKLYCLAIKSLEAQCLPSFPASQQLVTANMKPLLVDHSLVHMSDIKNGSKILLESKNQQTESQDRKLCFSIREFSFYEVPMGINF